jgi:hypothetical protein
MPKVINLANIEQFTAINLLSDPGHVGGPVVLPNAFKVVFRWTLSNGKQANNVMYGVNTGSFTPTPTIADAIFTAVATGAAWTAAAGYLNPASSMSAVLLQDVRSAGQPFVSSTGAAKPGTGAGTPLPNEVAICATLRTAQVGASRRGRIYIPAINGTAVGAADIILAATVTALNTWVGGFIAAFAASGLTMSLGLPARSAYTGTTGTLHPARIASTVPITAVSLRDNRWDSQRRRGLK